MCITFHIHVSLYEVNSFKKTVYKDNAPSKLLVPSDQDYDVEHNAHGTKFFQEDGLEGTFVINIFEGLQSSDNQEREVEEIEDPNDLRMLNRLNVFVSGLDSDVPTTLQLEEIEDVNMDEVPVDEEADLDDYF
jgi:hypothetical protein